MKLANNKFPDPQTYLLSEPLFPLQSLLPPLDLRLVHVLILLILILVSHPVHVEPIVWRRNSYRKSQLSAGAVFVFHVVIYPSTFPHRFKFIAYDRMQYLT